MRFSSLVKALRYIAKNPNLVMYGSVFVSGRDYQDDEMKQLLGQQVKGWAFSDGMTVRDGANIYVA